MSVRASTPSDREIRLIRDFAAPRERVFAALTEPRLLIRWYGARGWNLVTCEVDLRVGGAYRFVSHGPGGAVMGQRGVYREITPPSRLTFTELFDDQSYPGESLITHDFVEWGGRTTLTSTLLYVTREGRDTVLRYPMARGVAESYDRLAELLRSRRP